MGNRFLFNKIKPFLEKRKKDYIFKTMVNSAFSFFVTLLFALYNGFLGIRLSSVWHGSISIFYLLLVIIRGMILFTERNNRTRSGKEKARTRRRTFAVGSVMLSVLNLALILPISLMVTMQKPINIGLIPAITMAAYTTYKITMASVRIRRQRHENNNVLVTELRTINFIDALVSVLTLQNTLIMVNQTKSDAHDMLVLSAVTSAVIYLFIVVITIRLLTKGFSRRRN